ncbi:MAG: ATP-binding cassette domain-containing protein [Gemmatimonadota bacterium]|nr:ATP-binding cassette domain-containing protein [Gemmatimonadota bacterium]
MTDETRDDTTPLDDANPVAEEKVEADRKKRDADRRGGGRRVAERKPESVRAAIRDQLAEDAPEAREREAEKERSGESEAVIELDHVYLAFDTPILEDVSFVARQGETICIVGESGTGKSTTLKLILRLLVPDKGGVCIGNKNITALTFKEALEVRQTMGMVFQGAALFDSMSVFENIAYPLREHTTLDDDEIEARVREKLQFVDLDPDRVMEQLPSELSGGMRKRVGIARGMADNPHIMLYDEPTSGLDPLTTGTITRLIMKLQRELNVTSVVVSHDIRSVFRMATKVAVLNKRRIAFFGTPEEMAASDDEYLRDFLGGY